MTPSPSDVSQEHQSFAEICQQSQRHDRPACQSKAISQGHVTSVIPKLVSHIPLCLHLKVEGGHDPYGSEVVRPLGGPPFPITRFGERQLVKGSWPVCARTILTIAKFSTLVPR